MKREANLFESIIDLDNLALAAHKAFRGKSKSAEVFAFRSGFAENLIQLQEDIISDEIEIGRYHQFVIYEPKKRVICAAPLRQRILHHAIMNVCHPIFDRQLIFDSYASRPEKGTHKAIERVMEKSSRYRYFVKLDVRKFFDSIDHAVLKDLLSRMFKDKTLLGLMFRIIDSYGSARGLPIGNLTSQYFANQYLSPLDHYMKEQAGAEVYVRYMDDVIMMAEDKTSIKKLTNIYCRYAEDKLLLSTKPAIIGLCSRGIPFLGYKIHPQRIMMNGKGKRRFRKNIQKLNRLFERAVITEREYADRLMANVAYSEFADSLLFRKQYFG